MEKTSGLKPALTSGHLRAALVFLSVDLSLSLQQVAMFFPSTNIFLNIIAIVDNWKVIIYVKLLCYFVVLLIIQSKSFLDPQLFTTMCTDTRVGNNCTLITIGGRLTS